MPTLRFENPAALTALILVPLAGLLWWRACRRAADARALLSEGCDQGRLARWLRADALKGALRLSALGALVLGLAGAEAVRPDASSAARGDGVPVVFVMDVSASMAAADVKPDRLACAREAVAQLSALIPWARVGIVAVAEDAAVACPPTADHGALLDVLSQIRTNWVGFGGTRLATGVEKARSLIVPDSAGGVIVIVSDGEDHGDSLDPVLRQMKREGMTTDVVIVGSTEGAVLEGVPSAGTSGAAVTRADPKRMSAWAAAGGGSVWSVTPAGVRLPTRADELISRKALAAAGRRAGGVRSLAACLYGLAAALLVADLLVRP